MCPSVLQADGPPRKLRASGLLEDALVEFLDYLALERRLSPHTVQAYGRDLRQLSEFLQRRVGDAIAWRSIDRFQLRAWLAELSRSRSPRSMGRKIAAVRTFFSHLQERFALKSNPTTLLSSPKLAPPLARFLDQESAAEVMETAEPKATHAESPTKVHAAAMRDSAMLETLYGCGLRVSELTGLDLQDLQPSEEHDGAGQLLVRGKGSKERMVPVGRAAARALSDYLKCRMVLVHPKTGRQHATALFLGQRGTRLGVRRVQTVVRRLGAEATGRPDLSPHALRHSCATHMLEGGPIYG